MNKKSIFVIDDDGRIFKSLQEELNKRGTFYFENAYSFASAYGLWCESKEKGINFDCIILDLNIGIQQTSETIIERYYPLIGMAFFDKVYIEMEEEEKEKFLNKLVIYSQYNNELIKNSPSFSWPIDKMNIVTKEPFSIQSLVEKVIKIIN